MLLLSAGFMDKDFRLGYLFGTISFLYGIITTAEWRKVKDEYKRLLLQEAIAKGVEIGMKKAKET